MERKEGRKEGGKAGREQIIGAFPLSTAGRAVSWALSMTTAPPYTSPSSLPLSLRLLPSLAPALVLSPVKVGLTAERATYLLL